MTGICPEFESLLVNIMVGPDKRMLVNDRILCELFQGNECSDISE